MTSSSLHALTDYNAWANLRLLDASAYLTDDERKLDLRASFRSLQGTLVHILWGERGWLNFWQVAEFVPRPPEHDSSDFADLRRAWAGHAAAYRTYLRELTQADLDGPRTLDATVYSLGELIQHALNHSTYHRGQVALLLRQLGHAPPSTDFHDFLAEVRSVPM